MDGAADNMTPIHKRQSIVKNSRVGRCTFRSATFFNKPGSDSYVDEVECTPTPGAHCHGHASAPICKSRRRVGTSVKVKYSNRLPPKGGRHLYAQIERAANYACGTSSMDMEAMMNAPALVCMMRLAVHTQRQKPNLAQCTSNKNGKDEAQKFGISSDVMTAKK